MNFHARCLLTLALPLVFITGCPGPSTEVPDVGLGLDGGSDGAVRDAGHDAAVAPHDAGIDAAALVDGGIDAAALVDAGTDAAPDAFVDHCAGVVCTAADACHTVGTCDPATGICSSPAVADGTSCTDANACTTPDTCQAGACTPGAAVVCTAADACHVAGTCSAATGCSTVNATDGTSCPFASGAGGCTAGACVARCSDGVRDGTESDIDCAGGCPACALTRACAADADCMSNACDAVSLTCVASQCTDHRRDGVETDLDCGGSTCAACPVGRGCLVSADCVTNACSAASFLCVASQCVDSRRDGLETDVDCGGGACTTCATGKGCTVNTDCTSSACDALSLTCVASQCIDERRDGSETDVDCGGGVCATCGTARRCLVDSDCASNACDAVSLICVTNQCTDHRQDGSESDVDCGGSACTSCLTGQRCTTSFDCQAGHPCSAATHTCL